MEANSFCATPPVVPATRGHISSSSFYHIVRLEALQLQQLRDSVKAGVQATLAANLRESVPT
jgi:hypothetical protein